MMKGFVKFSKLMGLMLLASGLLFAGCAGPGSSTDEAVSSHGGFMIPITVDTAKLTMDVGDGAGLAVGTWSGHQVGLQTAGACGGTPTAATCTIRVTNLDPNYYMANTYIALSYCADCVGDKFFSDADLSNGVTVFLSGDINGTGGMADINGSEYCVVEDGVYQGGPYPEPFNATGCVTVDTKGNRKPLQFIHPDCGSRDVPWTFSTATGTNFRFYANIAADWFPEVPLADPRFDFQNRTTYYLTLNSLNDDKIAGAANKTWWRLGSYYRSSALTGYGSGGADFTPAPLRYFALNVLAEYPDRIEQEGGAGYADSSGMFSDYEYYINWAWVIRYDPTVIKAVAASGAIKKGGTTVYNGGRDLCDKEAGACAVQNTPVYTGLDGISTTTNFGGVQEAAGYLFSYSPITPGPFVWNISGQSYNTTFGGNVVGGYGDIWPVNAGARGLVKVNMAVATATYPNTNWWVSTAMIPSGTPDPEPEIGLGMYYFKVQPGTTGRGTQLYADMWVTEGGPLINWTNGTAAGGFNGALSDDWAAPCLPIQAGYEGNQGCNDSLGINAYWVFHSTEPSNPNILHSGTTVPNRGAWQYWNVHLCVL